MVTSFLSEHSAEFCLVPNLSRVLEERWSMTPVYFWSTREGSRLARECDDGQQITVLAMFARRPKMLQVGDETIQVKVNASLQRRAFDLLESGIPVLCGVPVVSSILDFSLSSPCVWFSLIPTARDHEDMYIEIDKKTGTIIRSNSNESFCTLAVSDIQQLANDARSMVLSQAIENIKEIGRAHNSKFSWFGASYKPVYFLLRRKGPVS